jgi:hypothetical protein
MEDRVMSLIKLDCGRSVSVDSFFYTSAYGGLMEGRPNRQLNEQLVEEIKKLMMRLWLTKTHVIPPQFSESDSDHPILPPIAFGACLRCNDPIDSRYMGSHLVVVWFGYECDSLPPSEVVKKGVHAVAWEKLAQDFDW